MNDGLQLGTVAGIRISIHWSWLVVFVLLTWTLADNVFPDQNPGLSDTAYVVMALAAAVLFFSSLLLHELGHAFQARREGMEIEGVTLWLFGGVARFTGAFPGAGAEFRVALAGPVVSLLLGLGFVALAWGIDLPQSLDGVAAWLGFINLFLLAFNMLPAFPLDGGRVLRSALWKLKGDFAAATRTASVVGRGFGYLFIGLGLAEFLLLSSFGGIWLAFLGWFLLQAATAEARHLATRQALGGLRVADLMVRNPATVPEDMPLGELMDNVLSWRRFTTYPVVDNGHAVGLLPFRCVAEIPRSQWDTRAVRDCMLPRDEVPVVAPGDSLIDALDELSENDVRRALVEDGDRLVGLLSITDLVGALEAGGPRRRR